ncbi:MAG: hypothetical protein ACE5L6_03065 [Candidatus Bathyarchaeia archaeon]
MSLKKSGVKKSNFRLQDSGLFGIIEKITPTTRMETTTVEFPVPVDHQARRLVTTAMLEAEYYKAQAITLARRTSIR